MLGRVFPQPADYAQGLAIALKATVGMHDRIQRYFTAMTKRRMPKIMAQANGFDQAHGWNPRLNLWLLRIGLAQALAYARAYLRYLQRMREAGAIKIAVPYAENLGFGLQAAKRRRVNNTRAVTLIFAIQTI